MTLKSRQFGNKFKFIETNLINQQKLFLEYLNLPF